MWPATGGMLLFQYDTDMLITDLEKARKLAKARAQPNLWFTPYSPHSRLNDIRSCHFPDLPHRVDLYFVNRGAMACVCDTDSSATIYIHQILNHAETPIEVIEVICKHELLHLRIPPIIEGKKEIQHPPEFWEAEREISPERNLAWSWIWSNLWFCLKKRPRLERVDVLPAWKSVWCAPKIDLAACQKKCNLGPVDEEKGW